MASKRKRDDIDETEEQRNSETETTAELEKRPCRSDYPELNYEHSAPDNSSEFDSPYRLADKTKTIAELEPRPSCSHDDPGFYEYGAPWNLPESVSSCRSADRTETTAELEPRPSCSHDDPGFYEYSAPCNLPESESPCTSADKNAGLQVLGSIIKANELFDFIQYVWSNPELLYNRDGTLSPVVYNGTHYNLIQIAVIFDRPIFCQLILDILEHPKFIQELFPFFVDEDEIRAEMAGVIKLYLNSKSSNGETALHYASEYGHVNCCRILLSHPFCEISSLNEGGFPVNEVICLKAEGRRCLLFNIIQEFFAEGMLYVPVYRSCRGTSPLVGKPTQCQEFNSVIFNPVIGSGFPADERQLYYLNAFAGPMSRKKAEIFYTALGRPSNSHLFTLDEKNDLERIKREEPERGVERIGRSLAKDMGIYWKEFFPTLNVFTNLAADEGLMIFEDFLLNKKRNGYPLPVLPPPYTEEMNAVFLPLLHVQKPHINPLCHRANNLYCFSQKFITVKVGHDDENEVMFSPAEPCCVPFPAVPSSTVPLGSSPICLNSISLTDLDRDVHAAVKRDFDPSLYREVSYWMEKIGEELKNQYARMGINGDPLPVPRPLSWE